ncbi:ATPase inhibitor mai-2, mitochondrial-like isoform X3 [Lineus longissimus]|uniref:ATPase inhibitor mai-2, mitochondrial-like isoform X3 n=1 Tax=Lineus longissimus TaxID=88925 RepID=UPI00315C6C52
MQCRLLTRSVFQRAKNVWYDNVPSRTLLERIRKGQKYEQGGGKGGSIRDAGGSFGKMEAAREEEYFRKLQQSQLRGLRAHLEEEVKFHETEIVGHKEAIERHKKRIGQLHHEEKKHKKDDD